MSTQAEAQAKAIMSLLDVVEEIANEVAKDPRWAETVRETFENHRVEIRETLT